MKKFIHTYLVFITLSIICNGCATNLIKNVDITEKAQIKIMSPTKAAFFVENERIATETQKIIEHRNNANSIYNAFGQATDKLIVGRTNAQTFIFNSHIGNWMIDVNSFKKRSALILFNGKNKPIIEFDYTRYGNLINKHFSKELSEANPLPMSDINRLKTVSSYLDSIWDKDFKPDKKYANKLITNANTTHYSLPWMADDAVCDGKIRITSFTDSTKQHVNFSADILYDKGRMMTYAYLNNKYAFITQYHYNELGLLDSIVNTGNSDKPQVTIFKYLEDRYITRSNVSNTWDEFVFNHNKQVVQKKSYNENNELTFKTIYYHDEQGRIIREENYRQSILTDYRTYENKNSNSINYTAMKYFDAKNSLNYEQIRSKKNGIEYFIGIQNNKTTTITKREMKSPCEGKVINSDANGIIRSIEVYEKL